MFYGNRCVAWHCIETCIQSLEWFGPTVTKLCSGQGNPDAEAATTATTTTTDKSNPYMFQAAQKCKTEQHRQVNIQFVNLITDKNTCSS